MYKYTKDVPIEIDETRLTHWLGKESGFTPKQVMKVIRLKNGKKKYPRVREQRPKLMYTRWISDEKWRINHSGITPKVQIVELIDRDSGCTMMALYPMKITKKFFI